MGAARLVSRSIDHMVRVQVQVPSCSGPHYDPPPSWMKDTTTGKNGSSKWASPMWLVGENNSKTSAPEMAAQTQTHPHPHPQTQTQLGDALPAAWANVADVVAHLAPLAQSTKPTKAQLQMLLERGMMDCRFFTLLAVAGSLLGSILCFVEGSVMVSKSYFNSFLALSHRSDVGSVAHLLIEAIDMFIIGTAMLMFGMGMHTMFVVSESTEKSRQHIPQSNLFGLFSLKTMPRWVELQSLSQAKSRIGHAVMMILQVGILEKFKNIPLVTGLDLACFAGAVVVSSACIFILAKLSA